MLVAEFRGARFGQSTKDGVWSPVYSDILGVHVGALADVARALGYKNEQEYNNLCKTRPHEVRDRLENL